MLDISGNNKLITKQKALIRLSWLEMEKNLQYMRDTVARILITYLTLNVI